MNLKSSSFPTSTLLALLGGASLGAVAVALTTPKTGREVRKQLLAVANRLSGKTAYGYAAEDGPVEMLFI